MSIDLTNPMFTNEDAARAYFEGVRWPDGPVCPHCGVINEATLVKGQSHRPGLYQCNACREPFTVTIGSVMESSHVPLHKWALAFRLMASSKKGVSAHQLMRSLGLGSYRTAWFMAHRVREAMADRDPEPLGGKGKTVEIDETFIGKPDQRFVNGKGWQGKRGTATKRKVLTMVERGGRSGFFGIFKRGMIGTFHHCGENHLQAYLNEFDFRYSNRIKLGVDDTERMRRAVKGAEGKRLTYKQPRSPKSARAV